MCDWGSRSGVYGMCDWGLGSGVYGMCDWGLGSGVYGMWFRVKGLWNDGPNGSITVCLCTIGKTP